MGNNAPQPDITLTASQQKVLNQLVDFVFRSSDRVFILKGYAGTGKTTLMRFLIAELDCQNKAFKLLAPTGRAAKILTDATHREAGTIHSLLYSRPRLSQDLSDFSKEDLKVEKTGQLLLNFEAVELNEQITPNTLYIVDESSMVADCEQIENTQAIFGSGKLLTDLMHYDTRPDSKFLFVGDPCQLNPINEVKSPALMPDYFRANFNLNAQEASLTEIMRQKNGNDLIGASKLIRKMWSSAPELESAYPFVQWGAYPLRYCKETRLYPDLDQMVDAYIDEVRNHGYASATLISASNGKCLAISKTVREALGFTSPVVQKGDLLLVIQNNNATGLQNGDMVEVLAVDSHVEYRAGIEFQKVTVKDIVSNEKFTLRLMVTTLKNSFLNLDWKQQTALYVDFIFRMKERGIDQRRHSERFYEQMMEDPYLNALRCKYGYAITCHKAQGGEWDNVFVDFGMMAKNITKGKCEWAYTAITRTKQTLHILNKPYFN